MGYRNDRISHLQADAIEVLAAYPRITGAKLRAPQCPPRPATLDAIGRWMKRVDAESQYVCRDAARKTDTPNAGTIGCATSSRQAIESRRRRRPVVPPERKQHDGLHQP